MVKQINKLSDKKSREKIKGQVKMIRQELRRPVLDKEKKIDFYPQWKPQQGVREEEEGEEYLSVGEDGRPYIKLRRKQTIGRNRKKAEEICRPEGEREEYLSEGEDGRPCIK